jgi:hypothetical protein
MAGPAKTSTNRLRPRPPAGRSLTRPGPARQPLLEPVGDPAPLQVVRADLDLHPVAG